jgi:mannobiose 2-epimerase
MHERFGKETGRYFEAARKQWKFIRDFQIDGKHGEWFGSVTREGKPLGDQDKASPWKAAYHNGRALMNGSRILRRLAQHADR